MASPHPFIRAFLQAVLLACPAIALLPAGASVMRSTADRASVPAAGDANSQRLIDATKAVVGVKVRGPRSAGSTGPLGRDRRGWGVLSGDDGLVLPSAYPTPGAARVGGPAPGGATIPATVVAYDH